MKNKSCLVLYSVVNVYIRILDTMPEPIRKGGKPKKHFKRKQGGAKHSNRSNSSTKTSHKPSSHKSSSHKPTSHKTNAHSSKPHTNYHKSHPNHYKSKPHSKKASYHKPKQNAIDISKIQIVFHCNICGLEFNTIKFFYQHCHMEHHGEASVNSKGNLINICCQKCFDTNLTHLHVVTEPNGKLDLYCNRCMNGQNFIYITKTPVEFLSQFQYLWMIKNISCAKCGSTKNLLYCEGYDIFCSECIAADTKLQATRRVPQEYPNFIESYLKGKVVIPKQVENSQEKTQEAKTTSKPSRVSIRNDKDDTTPEIDEIIETAELNSQTAYVSKLKKLKNLILNTTSEEPKLQYDSMVEYLRQISYGLFLEELFDTDIFDSCEVDPKSNIGEKGDISIVSPLKESMALLPEYMRHLRQSPFTRSQAVIIMQKEDSQLLSVTRPKLWYCKVQFSKSKFEAMRGHKRGKKFHDKKVLLTVVHPFAWNEKDFKGLKRVAILPCSTVNSRVFDAMERLSSPLFKQLLLGHQDIKTINFHNRISHYTNVLNDSQKTALQSALNNKITILRGPPGSGKTSTIYEMIIQLIDQLNYYPVLVVAASNLAVDNIAEKLMKDHKDSILRIVSVSKESEYDQNHPLADICLHNKLRKILPPVLKEDYDRLKSSQGSMNKNEFQRILNIINTYSPQFVNQAKVIFSTTVGISGPHLKNINKIPAIIMDEATQTSEPSCLIPLAAQGIKKIVFVGDEAQLSAFTRVRTFEMSLFERCLKNGTSSILLNTQYRMHPEISDFPRNKFYNGLLKDGITAEDRKLEAVKYPLFFLNHASHERTEHTRSNYSIYNSGEVELVERIIEKLVVDKHIERDRIGVMTGYAAQRKHLADALQGNAVINPDKVEMSISEDMEGIEKSKNVTVCNINGIIVATVDAFQGREKDFIIMSCVRSNSEGNIGFLRDRRRMNVALTRARCSLILCGDATCLSKKDPLWKEYLKYLSDKGRIFTSLDSY